MKDKTIFLSQSQKILERSIDTIQKTQDFLLTLIVSQYHSDGQDEPFSFEESRTLKIAYDFLTTFINETIPISAVINDNYNFNRLKLDLEKIQEILYKASGLIAMYTRSIELYLLSNKKVFKEPFENEIIFETKEAVLRANLSSAKYIQDEILEIAVKELFENIIDEITELEKKGQSLELIEANN